MSAVHGDPNALSNQIMLEQPVADTRHTVSASGNLKLDFWYRYASAISTPKNF